MMSKLRSYSVQKISSILITLLLLMIAGGCTKSFDRALVSAAKANNIDQIGKLVARGANPNALAVDGWTALTVAAREGNADAVAALIRRGADVNLAEGGGNTLYWASFYGHSDVVRVLLAEGADVNRRRSGGESPLHVALRLQHEDVAALLRNNGAKE